MIRLFFNLHCTIDLPVDQPHNTRVCFFLHVRLGSLIHPSGSMLPKEPLCRIRFRQRLAVLADQHERIQCGCRVGVRGGCEKVAEGVVELYDAAVRHRRIALGAPDAALVQPLPEAFEVLPCEAMSST